MRKHDSPFVLMARLAVLLVLVPISGCTTLGLSNSTTEIAKIDAASLAKTQAGLALEKAETAEREGQADDAIRYYEQARTQDAKYAYVSRRLAVLYDQRGNDARARAAYEDALKQTPDDADLLNDFGVYHLNRENWTAAEANFQQGLAVDPAHQRARNNLAMSLAMQNRLQESYQAFSQVVGPAAAHSNLGVLLAKQGRTEEARGQLRQALSIDPSLHVAIEFLKQLDK